MRQSELERKAFLTVIVIGLVSGILVVGARAAIGHQFPTGPVATAAGDSAR